MIARRKPTARKKPVFKTKPSGKKATGRRAHEPTQVSRQMCKALVFEGVPQARIAAHMRIDPKTLRKSYRQEIDFETEKVCSLVAMSMARIATRPKGDAASVSAGRFILACRGGPAWRETTKLQIEGAGRRRALIEEPICQPFHLSPDLTGT